MAAVLLASASISAAMAGTSTATFYLDADSEPIGSLSQSSPPGGPLPNYDPDRDKDALGLVLKDSDEGMAETDPDKYQRWQMKTATGLHVSGKPVFRIWSVMKDYDDDKEGQFTSYLLDCLGSSCSVLSSVVKTRPEGAGWSQQVITFPTIDHVVPTGHFLGIQVVVTKASESDMWFAYHTSTYPSRLEIPIPSVVTTTSSTTTTKPPPVTTTTKPPSATTITAIESSTTTTGSSTTTLPEGTTTTTGATPTTESQAGPISPTTTTPASPDARPVDTATEKSSLVVETGESTLAEDVFASEQTLSPQEGLMVSFLSAAETVRSKLLASVVLGAIGALLVAFGMRRKMDAV